MSVPTSSTRAPLALALGFLCLVTCLGPTVGHAQGTPPEAHDTATAPTTPDTASATTDAEGTASDAERVSPAFVALPSAEAPAPSAVADVATTREDDAPASSPRLTASIDEGFSVDSADGSFGVRIGALIQYRLSANESASGHYDTSFQSFMVRPQIRMHAFGQKLRVFIQPEFAGTGSKLLDLELTYQPHAAFALRAGQFLTPFSRTFYTPVPLMQYVDFGVPNDVFRVSRDTGVMAFGTAAEGRFEYYLAAFNGTAINRDPSERVRGMGVARVVYSPLGKVAYDQTPFLPGAQPFRFSVGVNGYLQRVIPTHTMTDLTTGQTITVQDAERRNQTIGADLTFYVDRFVFLGELYYRDQRVAGAGHTQALGAYAQAGYYIAPAHLEISGRIGYVDPNRDASFDAVHTYEGALTGYVHGNHAKIALRYLFGDAGTALSGLHVGHQHRLTLQGQVYF